MSSSTNEGAFGSGKLVPGFDAGCSTSGDVARRIEEEVGGEAPATDVGTAGMSRRQFLKGAGGTALAFGILFGIPFPAQSAQDELNEEALAEALSLIEDIPDSVAAQGEEAARQWLERKVQADPQEGGIEPHGVLGCARAIIIAIISNAIPVLKIRRAIRVFGGARNLARFIARTYRRFRRLRNSVGTSIKKTARAVAKRVFNVTGENVLGAMLALLSLEGVKNECF